VDKMPGLFADSLFYDGEDEDLVAAGGAVRFVTSVSEPQLWYAPGEDPDDPSTVPPADTERAQGLWEAAGTKLKELEGMYLFDASLQKYRASKGEDINAATPKPVTDLHGRVLDIAFALPPEAAELMKAGRSFGVLRLHDYGMAGGDAAWGERTDWITAQPGNFNHSSRTPVQESLTYDKDLASIVLHVDKFSLFALVVGQGPVSPPWGGGGGGSGGDPGSGGDGGGDGGSGGGPGGGDSGGGPGGGHVPKPMVPVGPGTGSGSGSGNGNGGFGSGGNDGGNTSGPGGDGDGSDWTGGVGSDGQDGNVAGNGSDSAGGQGDATAGAAGSARPQPGHGSGQGGNAGASGALPGIGDLFGLGAAFGKLRADSWAWANLLLMLLGLILAGLTVLKVALAGQRTAARARRKRTVWAAVVSAVAVLGALLFFLLEDIYAPPVPVDRWTVLFAVLAAVCAGGRLYGTSGRAHDKDESHAKICANK
jgi:hypothetical protein